MSGLVDLAAVPRSFDASLLAALAGRDEHAAEFAQAFHSLIRLPMVQEHGPGAWAVHDSMRRTLLASWAERGEGQLEKQLLHLRRLHSKRYEGAASALAALSKIENLVRDTNEARFVKLREDLGQQLVRSALDGVHTAVRISFQAGLGEFSARFEDLLSSGSPDACELLVRSWTQDALLVEANDRTLFHAWGKYYQGQVLMAREVFAAAYNVFDGIEVAKSPDERTARLASLVSGARTGALIQLSRFDEAFAELRRRIELNERFHKDDDVIANGWLQQSQLHGLLMDTVRAKDTARQSLDVASRLGSEYDQIWAQIRLAQAAAATGERSEAMSQLLAALYRSRRLATSEEQSAFTRSAILESERVATLIIGPSSRRSLATLTEQRRELTSNFGSAAILGIAVDTAVALAKGGDRTGATTGFGVARKFASDREPTQLWAVEADQAQWSNVLGMPAAALVRNCELLADPRFTRDPWTRARAATNGLTIAIARGEFALAQDLVQSARDVWEERRVEYGARFVDILEGELMTYRGQLKEARGLLSSVPQLRNPDIEGERTEALARLDLAEASYDSAADHALAGLELAERLRDMHALANRGALAVDCLLRSNRLGEASKALEDLQRCLVATRSFAEWRPEPATTEADAHASRSIWILVLGLGTPLARTVSAIEHLELAVKRDPSGGWCHLELAWLFAITERRKRAVAHLQAAAETFEDDILKEAVLASRLTLW